MASVRLVTHMHTEVPGQAHDMHLLTGFHSSLSMATSAPDANCFSPSLILHLFFSIYSTKFIGCLLCTRQH